MKLFATLLAFASAALAASAHKSSSPSVVYVTLSDTPATGPSVIYVTVSSPPPPAASPSIVYVTLGAPPPPPPSAPAVTSPGHITSLASLSAAPVLPAPALSSGTTIDFGDPSSPDADPSSVPSGYTVETYAIPYETGSTVGAGPGANASDSDPATDVSPVTVTDTVTVTQNVTYTESPTGTSTSIYLPVFTTSSRRHRFF